VFLLVVLDVNSKVFFHFLVGQRVLGFDLVDPSSDVLLGNVEDIRGSRQVACFKSKVDNSVFLVVTGLGILSSH
jgi:hypothetical protein